MQQSFCNWLAKRKYGEKNGKRRQSEGSSKKESVKFATDLGYHDYSNASIENMQTVVHQSRHSSITSLVSSRNGSISIPSGDKNLSSGRNSGSGKSGRNSASRNSISRASGSGIQFSLGGNSPIISEIVIDEHLDSPVVELHNCSFQNLNRFNSSVEYSRRRMSCRPRHVYRPQMIRQNTWDETNMRKMVQTASITGYGRAIKNNTSLNAVSVINSKNKDRVNDFRKDKKESGKEHDLVNMIPGLKL